MKKKYLALALVPVLGVVLFGVNAVSARGSDKFTTGGFGGFFGGFGGQELSNDEIVARHQAMFAEQATLLGVSADAVKNAWAEGKSLFEIAEANGISKDTLAAKMQNAHTARMKAHLQTLVTNGVITQAQADQRFSFMQNHEGHMGGKMLFRGPDF